MRSTRAGCTTTSRHFAASLKAFFADLGSAASRVTVVTISEFGRRLEENGDGGIDHGYGNAMLVLGAGVDGGQVHGGWPGLADDDLEDGDLAIRQDYRSVLWEVMSHRFPAISGEPGAAVPRPHAGGRGGHDLSRSGRDVLVGDALAADHAACRSRRARRRRCRRRT